MKRGQRPSAEQVVLMLRQIELQTDQEKRIVVACQEADVSEQSDDRWRQADGWQVGKDRVQRIWRREG